MFASFLVDLRFALAVRACTIRIPILQLTPFIYIYLLFFPPKNKVKSDETYVRLIYKINILNGVINFYDSIVNTSFFFNPMPML